MIMNVWDYESNKMSFHMLTPLSQPSNCVSLIFHHFSPLYPFRGVTFLEALPGWCLNERPKDDIALAAVTIL